MFRRKYPQTTLSGFAPAFPTTYTFAGALSFPLDYLSLIFSQFWPDSTVLGRMDNPLAVTALGWTRTFMIVITFGTQRFRPSVWFPVTIACRVGPGPCSAFYSVSL
ncbi:hypothetical protein Tco_0247516 [Tanacetum coccineum]